MTLTTGLHKIRRSGRPGPGLFVFRYFTFLRFGQNILHSGETARIKIGNLPCGCTLQGETSNMIRNWCRHYRMLVFVEWGRNMLGHNRPNGHTYNSVYLPFSCSNGLGPYQLRWLCGGHRVVPQLSSTDSANGSTRKKTEKFKRNSPPDVVVTWLNPRMSNSLFNLPRINERKSGASKKGGGGTFTLDV